MGEYITWKRYSLIGVVALMLAACAQAEPAPLPTLAPTLTPIVVTAPPSPTPITRPTLPPTWTPEVAASVLPPEAGGRDNQATPTPEMASQVEFVPATLLPACATFGEDRERNVRSFVPGTAPQVFWTPVEGAVSYSVSLIDETGEILFTGYTAEPTIVFDAELLEASKLYGWEVYPIDALGRQMCFARGAELFPEGLPGRQ